MKYHVNKKSFCAWVGREYAQCLRTSRNSHPTVSSRGILLRAWSSGATTHIYGNSIEMENARSGIEVSMAEGIKVYQNAHINMNVVPPFDAYGIHVSATANGYFGCNGIRGVNAGNGGNAYVGMYYQDSYENTISCNTTNETTKGLEFRGDCHAENKVIGNEMREHYWGLYVNPSSFIFEQDHTGNMWTANGGIYGSTFGAENFGNYLLSYMPVDGTNPIFTTNAFPSGWIDPVGGVDNGCSSTECGGSANIIGEGITNFDYITANDSIVDSLYQAELQYSADRYLYKKLQENPNFLPANGIIYDFYTDNTNNSVGKFTEIEQDQKEIQENQLFLQLQTIQENIEVIKEQLRLTDSLFVATNDSSVLQGNDSLNLVIQNLQIQNTTVSEQVNAYHSVQSIIIDTKNNAVIDNALFESNEKAINEIYLNTIAKAEYNFSQNQINIIDNIAHQCPYTGGKGVYKARSLYALFYPFELYYDTEVCASQNISWRKHNPISSNKSYINIYPNPAKDYITIDFSTQSEVNRQFFLYDIVGRNVLFYTISANEISTNIPLGKLAKGMYQVRIISQEHPNYTTKLIIE